jgi:hypothetical protein
MTYAMVYAENGDIVGTYASREDAVRRLETFVELHPEVQDEIGLRPYEAGRPVGAYEPATDVLGDRVTHPHLT